MEERPHVPDEGIGCVQRGEPSLTAEDAAAIGRAFASARFLPSDLPEFTVAAPVALEPVRPVVLGQKRPRQAAADAQEMADRIRERLLAAS